MSSAGSSSRQGTFVSEVCQRRSITTHRKLHPPSVLVPPIHTSPLGLNSSDMVVGVSVSKIPGAMFVNLTESTTSSPNPLLKCTAITVSGTDSTATTSSPPIDYNHVKEDSPSEEKAPVVVKGVKEIKDMFTKSVVGNPSKNKPNTVYRTITNKSIMNNKPSAKTFTKGLSKLSDGSWQIASQDNRAMTFDLSVTPIEPGVREEASEKSSEPTCLDNDMPPTAGASSENNNSCSNGFDKKTEIHACDSRKSRSNKSKHQEDLTLKTVRSRSAPPYSTVSFSPRTTSPRAAEEGRKYANVYWRARSAYHRSQEKNKPETNKTIQDDDAEKTQFTINDNVMIGSHFGKEGHASDDHILERKMAEESLKKRTNSCGTSSSTQVEDTTQSYGATKGTLLRPLLFSSPPPETRHSAGCPYQCRGCFKALLASTTYAREIRAYQLKPTFPCRSQSRNSRVHARTAPGSRSSVKKKAESVAAVKRENSSTSSQPLFRRVYRDRSSGPVRDRYRPWPEQGWTDAV